MILKTADLKTAWLCLAAMLTSMVLLSRPADAVLVTYTTESSWLAAVSSSTLEDFESADIGNDGDDNGGAEDLNFGFSDVTFGEFDDLIFSSNAASSAGSAEINNGQIDVRDFTNVRGGINGNVVVDINFLNHGDEYVEVTFPAGISAVSFIYRNGDSVGDPTLLSVDGVAVSDFDAEDPRYFDPADSSNIPGGGTGTGPGFFGLVSDTGTISTLRFAAADGTLEAGGGTTSFGSFDDVRYGVAAVPEPSAFAFLGLVSTLGLGVTGLRRKWNRTEQPQTGNPE
ncbi:hypothetical protein [Adhaeretor mobilis]|uniref:PEP-CTERM protein-sorting domain-containing protein n=1 Tax=Adhaeretor mobilis TaxID=1930276 RepID=A0A517MTP5_9BACT|nr:hypothetical protein [Adhaeretor mobilis]QDS98232.1 hypothetical protein HG15A2_15050 [Adhaeretor mobilis]